MAASNAPKNDFAPPWLKIPSPDENARPIGTKNYNGQDRNRQRRDEFYNRYNNGDMPRPLNRQNSLDVFEGSKRYSPNDNSKSRHHSVEDDYSYFGYGYGPYSVGYNDAYSMRFRSQPSLQHQDLKYPAASSRFGQVNGSYQPINGFFDFYPPGEGFSNYGAGTHASRRSHYAREGRAESKESKDSDRSSHEGDEKDWVLKDDFPSLKGTEDDGDNQGSKNVSGGGVWDNPPKSRTEESSEVKTPTPGLYMVVPNKGTSARRGSREGLRMNVSMRDCSPLAGVKNGCGKEGQRQSPTQHMEILSTRLVRPKPVDKKSEFLKALRRETDCGNGPLNGFTDRLHEESGSDLMLKGEEEMVKNGMDDLRLDQDQPINGSASILSSSIEEEFSFMRSLGWNPNEVEEMEEITEDEKREFQKKLSDKWQQQRNGQTRILPKSWSPQHLAPYSSRQPAQDLKETPSSSDTDSEDEA